jgi:hypothetical protein
MEPNRQQTFDDQECVLEPEQKEDVRDPSQEPSFRRKRALEVYAFIQAQRLLEEEYSDPLF